MVKRLPQALKRHVISTPVGDLLEQKRRQSETLKAAGPAVASRQEVPAVEKFIPATARPDLTNPLATPGSGMFPDSFDPTAPSG